MGLYFNLYNYMFYYLVQLVFLYVPTGLELFLLHLHKHSVISGAYSQASLLPNITALNITQEDVT